MKFETIGNNKKKVKITLGIVCIIAIIGITAFTLTRASYKQTQSVPLIKGNISYNKSDLEIVAIKLKDGSTYTNSDIVPTNGYVLNESESICKDKSGNKIETTFEYSNGKINVLVTKKGTKCILVFEKGTKLKDLILSKNTIDASMSTGPFTEIFEENTAGKIFSSIDDDGTTYFFAGSNPSNWVKFAGYYWRIIRINGDGSVRLIYNGINANQTGNSTQIETDSINDSCYANACVGFMYGIRISNTYETANANIHSSIIKTYLDEWYDNNLQRYENYIDTNAGFCGDRSLSSGNGYSENCTYTAYNRVKNKLPTYKCAQINDLYTITTGNKGNKSLANPVGLISVDEAIYAGGRGYTSSSHWLKTNTDYWTMSPSHYNDDESEAYVYYVGSGGSVNNDYVGNINGVRPVINLKGDILVTGSGTTSDFYKIN